MLFETRGATLIIAPKPLVIYEDIFHGTPVVETGSGEYVTIDMPTGTQVGDILFVFICMQDTFQALSGLFDGGASRDGMYYIDGVNIRSGLFDEYENPLPVDEDGHYVPTEYDTHCFALSEVVSSVGQKSIHLGTLPYDSAMQSFTGSWIAASLAIRGDNNYVEPTTGNSGYGAPYYYPTNIQTNQSATATLYDSISGIAAMPGGLILAFSAHGSLANSTTGGGFEEVIDASSSNRSMQVAWKYVTSVGVGGGYSVTKSAAAVTGMAMVLIPKS